ncbi:MAG: hypothetical protein Q8R82_09330 [Hyphomonadaceae bacterium]|nr:hypothetical protein [Hyphomonadaceae bacterium]
MPESEAKRQFRSAPAIVSLGLIGIACLLTVLFAGLVAYVTMYDAPYWDLWQHVKRENLLSDLFTRNNEHPVVTNRLMFWIDDTLFGASSRFVQIASLLMLAGQVVLFAWLARMAGIKHAFLLVAPVSAVFIFYPFGFENTIWIFQVSMVLAFTSALGAFTCLAAHAQTENLWALGGSVIFSVLAVLSFANGVFVPTLAFAMALWLKPKSSIPLLIIAIAAWTWQLSAAGGGQGVSLAPDALGQIAIHFFAQLGAPFGWAAGYAGHVGIQINNQHVAITVGVLAAVLSGLALVFVGLRARRNPAAVATMAVILFALVTAALVALSRFTHGLEQALSSRYNINVALLYSALLIVALIAVSQACEKTRNWLVWTGPVLTTPLLVIALSSAVIFVNLTGRYRGALEGTVALVAGVHDTDRIGQLSFNVEMAERETAEFRKNRKWMFAAPITLRVGEKLTAEETNTTACMGTSWIVSKVNEAEGFRAVEGKLPRQQLSVGAIHVLITDASGTVSGYGRIPRRASDLNPFAQQDGAIIDWIGRIRPNTSAPYRAWLADDRAIRCAL